MPPSLFSHRQITLLDSPWSSAEFLLSLPSKEMQNLTFFFFFYHLATSTLVQGTLISHWDSFKSLLALLSILSIHLTAAIVFLC